LAEVIVAMERAGLEILDIENLRRNYALTLDAWAQRFDANWERIHAIDHRRFDERFRRTWRTYLYSCAEMFRAPHGYTHLFQIVYSKGNVDGGYPMSRAHIYNGGPPG
ncbi:MAG TPA: class I SAM-dependent methyltransferase, partial [Burkholderiales bacterium]|nr:class I SAM-dependent methyltransferase [Burkholderiales bacterium]